MNDQRTLSISKNLVLIAPVALNATTTQTIRMLAQDALLLAAIDQYATLRRRPRGNPRLPNEIARNAPLAVGIQRRYDRFERLSFVVVAGVELQNHILTIRSTG